MPERIQLRRTAGWRKPPNTIVVSRPSMWSNPFRVGAEITRQPYNEVFGPTVRDRAHAVEIFRAYARITVFYAEHAQRELAGKNLACWCPLPAPGEPDLCHAAVLLEIANGEASC